MQYNYSERLTPQGITYSISRITHWYHLDVCPKCGKKITTCTMSCPPKYICDCLTKAEINANLC